MEEIGVDVVVVEGIEVGGYVGEIIMMVFVC